MSNDPSYASTPNVGSGTLSAAATATDGSATTGYVLILTGGASGTKVEEVIVESVSAGLTPTTVASLVYLFRYDGTTYWLEDVIPVTVVVASSTVAPFRANKVYQNLFLNGGGTPDKLYAAMSVAQTTGNLRVTAKGLNG